MHEQLQRLMKEHLDKQELLTKLTESEALHAYGYSDIHTVMAIGSLEAPNVTQISRVMHMSKGGVSKIIKRLLAQGLVQSYQAPDNRQKIFYRLTEKGAYLYQEHEKCHAIYTARDALFLQRYSAEQLHDITAFMTAYNEYLDQQIACMSADYREAAQ